MGAGSRGLVLNALAVAVATLAVACHREPECFRIDTRDVRTALADGGTSLNHFEVFVLANRPRDPDELLRVVEKACGPLDIPQVAEFSLQRWVFEESAEMSRTTIVRHGGRDLLFDKHNFFDTRDDRMLVEETASTGTCSNGLDISVYDPRRVEPVRRVRRDLPRPPDAGPVPGWCRK